MEVWPVAAIRVMQAEARSLKQIPNWNLALDWAKMRELLVFVAISLVGFVAGNGRSNNTGTAAPWRIHTLFSVECQNYFDWQTVGLMNSFKKSQQPGPITRLLSCTDEEKKNYRGMNLAPTFEVPSMSRHPKTGDWLEFLHLFPFISRTLELSIWVLNCFWRASW